MAESIENQILNKIKKAKGGSLFFTDQFLSLGNTKAINKGFERLVDKGELHRMASGIYVRPKKSKLFGFVLPGAEEVARAIAKRDKARIIPTGAYALNALGLSTQVPLKVVFLTNGAPRKIKMGKQTITFKKTSPRNVALLGPISTLAIQALKSIGQDKLTAEEEKKIVAWLKKEKITYLEHDIRLAPVWIRKIMKRALIKAET